MSKISETFKVLQLGKFYPPNLGGIETTIYNITEELNKRGIRCDVLCSNSKREYKEEFINNYKVYRTKSYGKLASTSISFQMISKLKEIIVNYDIVHVHHPDPMANLALFLTYPKDKKIVLHYHADIIRQKFFLKFYKPLLFWMLKRADAIIGTSSNHIEGSPFLKEFLHKVYIIPLGIKRLFFNEEEVKKIRNKFMNKKIVFSLGRMVYYKGFEYLIKSAEFLDNSYVILIGGDGPERKKLENLARKFKNKVFLLGKIPQEELGNYYQACDVFCLPSIERAEAFGLVIVEAMSFGKPIVATKIPYSGVSWVNQDDITGYNVEPKNPKALAEAIIKICEKKELYTRLSQNARERFKSIFTVEAMVNKIINLYESLLRT